MQDESNAPYSASPATGCAPSSTVTIGSGSLRFLGFPEKIAKVIEARLRIKAQASTLGLSHGKSILAENGSAYGSGMNCLWWDPENPPSASDAKGPCLLIGEHIPAATAVAYIQAGFLAALDLSRYSPEEIADLIHAYSSQASASPVETTQADSLRLLSEAVANLNLGAYLIRTDVEKETLVWNQEMERLFKVSGSDILKRSFSSRFDNDFSRHAFLNIAAGQSEFERVVFTSKPGRNGNFIADIFKTQLFDADGAPWAIFGTIQDVTNKIHSENRLITAFNELESSKKELLERNQENRKTVEKAKKLAVLAQSSNKAKSYFLSSVSHELRTPLNSIVSLTHALVEGTFGEMAPRQLENLEIVYDSSKHLQSLINDILDLSKIELGKMSLKLSTGNCVEVAHAAIRMISRDAEEKRVTCQLLGPDTPLELTADSRRLRQILLNLLVNAVKFTKPDSQITLQIEDEIAEGTVSFHVIDQGIGIEESDIPKIFSPFTQLDNSLSRQYEGTGLGLAIVSKFVELHGGSLRVSSQPGNGSRFTVTLPKSQPDSFSPEELEPSLSEWILHENDGRSLILIADEQPRTALAAKRSLETLPQTRAVIATPAEISAYQDQISPRAILVDTNLLYSHGTEWIQEARELESWQNARWIGVGSIEMSEPDPTFKKARFDAHCCRPLQIQHLKPHLP